MPAAHRTKASHAGKLKSKTSFTRVKRVVPLKLMIGFLALFSVLLLTSLCWKVYRGYKNKLWDNKTRLTIVVATENPIVYSFEPVSGTLVKFSIPKNTQIDTSNKFGKWYIGSLWKLGKLKGMEGELLRRSVQKSLGIPVDAWIDDSGEDLFRGSALGKFGVIQRAVLTGKSETNLTFFDRLNLLTKLTGDIREKELSLTATRVVVKTKLADGEEGYTVVADQASVTFEKFLRDDIVFSETKTVSVSNTSGNQGIGKEVARVAQVLGARVIGARSSGEKHGGVCVLRGEADAITTTSAARLAQIYGCTKEVSMPTSPASIELLLGENFTEEY